MHVLICNERLLFRFGVDRLLLLVGRFLRDGGHRISVMASRFDEAVVSGLAERAIRLPAMAGGVDQADAEIARWLESSWGTLFEPGGEPDVVLAGGWPFFSSIPVLARRGVPTVFVDAGAVPLDGYTGQALRNQEAVRALRRAFLPRAAAITPISEFIRSSQTRADAPEVPSRVILLGADHLRLDLWSQRRVESERPAGGAALEAARRLRGEGRKLVLNLGRWEAGCYKNSEAVLALAAGLSRSGHRASFLVLGEPGSIPVPAGLQDQVVPIGFPDDAELLQLMQQADAGVTVSLWEGFNLPLAEMQLEGRPVLALNRGAHPEVAAHPWFLCGSIEEMAGKLGELLDGGGPSREVLARAVADSAARLSWSRAADEYEALLGEVVPWRPILVDVTNAARDPANSGVIRVTRRLGAELQRVLRPIFVVWDPARRAYALPTEEEAERLRRFNGPVVPPELRSRGATPTLLTDAWSALPQKPTTLLLTETVMEAEGRHLRDWARGRGLGVAAIFYDAIPVLRPDLCADVAIRENHAAYMRGLAACDTVLAISGFSAECLRAFWKEQGLRGGTVRSVLLPGEFGTAERETALPSPPGRRVELLCVSTLEPRKNHRRLLEAFRLAARTRPDLDWRLTLVGNRSAGGEALAAEVEEACREDPRIRWRGVVDDAELHRLYAAATFTVYPSTIEGFGLPILESLWHARPCLCHREGVMAELARGGGCLTTDVTEARPLAEALVTMATDPGTYLQLARQAVDREIRGWPEYARRVAAAVARGGRSAGGAVAGEAPTPAPAGPSSWVEALYPRCRLENWQMSDSERMALTGVLARLQPSCSIEVGTYHGGSLSVISQFSRSVFSIDIDPAVPDRIRGLENVSFLIGPSTHLLPRLLAELDQAGMAVEFVLIDADHSAEGVRRDVEMLLDYVPRRPMVVLLHDGFNPECRRGMLAARWDRSPHVHHVDLDFVPGRVIEHGGGGDGEQWGGLALAYFDPAPRAGPLEIKQTAIKAFQRASSQAAPAPAPAQATRCAS